MSDDTTPTSGGQHGSHRSHVERREHTERMVMPENHLDTIVTTNSIDTRRRANLVTRLIAVILLPLFLVGGFTIVYNSAQSHPEPHDMALLLAGPSDTTKQIADSINDRAEHAFDITRTTDTADARNKVKHREAVGAIIVDGSEVTTVVAAAGGRVAVAPIETIGQQVADNLNGNVKVVDVAPVSDEDTSGTALFYYLILCTVGGYLSITVITQVLPKTRTRAMMITAAGAAVLAPIIGFAMISIFVGDFGDTFGTIAGTIGVGMVYTFAVGMIASFFTQVLGQAAIFAVLTVLMFFNFPTTGGSVPESMLPAFWQVVHNLWIGSGALESMRGLVYFDGAQFGHWFGQLCIWAGAATALTIVAGVVKHRRRAATPSETADDGVDGVDGVDDTRDRDVAVVGGIA